MDGKKNILTKKGALILVKLIILGSPGTGKGTLAQGLSKKWRLKHISTGDLLRIEVEKDSFLGKKIKNVLSKGELVSDRLIKDLLKKNLPKDNFILDGYPRTLTQAKTIEKISKINYIINLQSNQKTIIKRLNSRSICLNCKSIYGLNIPPKKKGICDRCGGKLIKRKDDNLETIKSRLIVYKKENEPLINYYKEKIININGNSTPKSVLKKTLKELNDRGIKIRT